MSDILATAHAALTDEALLQRYRMGDDVAFDVLLARKNARRHGFCHMASPKMKPFFDDWEINEIFFHAFYDAQATFEFTKGSFNAFLIRCLRFVMANRVDKKLSRANVMITNSFDEELNVKGDSSLVLADVVSKEGTLDDPREYVNFQDSVMEITNLPKNVNPLAVAIMGLRLEGFTVSEAAQILDISHKRASYILSRYSKWVRKLLHLGKKKSDPDDDDED